MGFFFVVVATLGVAWAGQFAGERFAPILDTSDTAALDIESISVEPADGSDVSFVVTFRNGFEPPSDGYRVAVSVGDPTGKRTRWTLSVTAGESTGVVETGDGVVWDQVGPTVAELDAPAGTASIVAQLDGTPPDSALWVEAEVPTPLGPFGAATTYFSYDLLAPEGSVTPTGTWGWIRDADGVRVDGAVRVPGTPPLVTVVNRALVVTAPDAGPSLLLDQPVTATADLVRVIDAGTGTDAGYVLVNRVTGEVQLFQIVDGAPVEVPDGGAAVVPSSAPDVPPAAEPPSTRPVSIDVTALTGLLGLPDDSSALAVTADRAFTLGDGSVVTVSGVAATLASLEPAGSPDAGPEPAADVVAVPDEGADEGIPLVAVLVAAGVALLAVIGAVLIVVVGRRRRRRHDSLLAEGWLDDEMTLRSPGGAAAEPAAAPVVLDLDAVEAGDRDNGREEPAADVTDVTEAPPTAVGARQAPSPDAARATQEQALADLEAQFADLVERVDRLGTNDNGST
jgi:hypothetical protein